MVKQIRLPSIYLPDEATLEIVKREADQSGLSISAWVRRVIQEELARKGISVDLAMQHGGRRPYSDDE